MGPINRSASAAPAEVKTSFGGILGLQLWSLREFLPKDVPGTLARVRDLGLREVEAAGLPPGMTAAAFRSALDKADLRCRSAHVPYEKLRDDLATVITDAKTIGAEHVVCPWIPHDSKKGFGMDDAVKAAELFTAVGQKARASGLRFAYHCHGYEFKTEGEGTLWDVLVGKTDKALVGFEIDTFWAKAGGADPARIIAALPGRVPLLHVKDMKKGLSLPAGSSNAPDDTNVAAGEGQLDWPAILQACRDSKTEIFYIEDESSAPWEQIPRTIAYLAGRR